MKKLVLAAVLLLLGSFYETYAQPYRWIVPGTMSHRLDGSLNAPQEFTNLYRGHYYGYDVGGGQTFWGNSSQYKEFALFEHVRKANFITQPSDVDVLPKKEWKRLIFNFRLAYPTAYEADSLSGEKYPLLLMMHGAGERADCWRGNCYGKSGDPKLYNNDHNVSHGGRAQINAINRDPSDPTHWPGFVVVPQNKNGWNPKSYVPRIFKLIEELANNYPIDMNRIYVHGLSNGADATWMLINERPDLFAAAQPMSGYANNGAYNYDVVGNDNVIHKPIRQFQGGRDRNPRQSSTEQKMQQMRNEGATPEYVLYPNLGHGTWSTAYSEPDFFSWFLQYSQLTIHASYGVSEVCEGDDVQVTLGISPGFDDYEWQKLTDTDTTLVPGKSGKPSEIIADEVASYRVRFARGMEWTEWSDLYTLTSKPRPTASIVADGTVALPGIDGDIDVTLTSSNQSGSYYEWYKDDVLYAEDSSLYALTTTEAGKYHLVVTDQGLCKSFASNAHYVSTLPYVDIVPAIPSGLTVISTDPSTIELSWSDTSMVEALGYDIYRSNDGGLNYTWAGQANDTLFVDDGLNGSTTYHYAIRAFNANGASDLSVPTSTNTLDDLLPPSAPTNFTVEGFNYTETKVRVNSKGYSDEHYLVHLDELILSWSPSSDNVGVAHYEVYTADSILMATTTETNLVLSGLSEDVAYTFYVVAKDLSGNSSSQSNADSFTTTQNGVKFNLFAGGTWDEVKEFSNWGVLASGTHNNFEISAMDSLYAIGDPDPNYFAFEFFGYIYIQQAGNYTFATQTDDGSQLWIGSDQVVDNDFLHGPVKVTGSPIYLAAGRHPITVKYFERTGGQTLNVYYTGADTGGLEVKIPDSALTSSGTPVSNVVAPNNLAETITNESNVSNGALAFEKLSVFPNPTESGNINIRGYVETESTTVNVQLIDMLGKIHFDAKMNIEQIANGTQVNVNQPLQTGVYIIQITDNLNTLIQKRLMVK